MPLTASPYYVQVSAPANSQFTLEDQGNGNGDSDVDPLTGQSDHFTLTAAAPDWTIDAGLFFVNTPPSISSGGLTLSPGAVSSNGSVTLAGTFADPDSWQEHDVQIDWGDGTSDW